MNPQDQPNEPQEASLQEPGIKVPDDTSLPATQVIAEQTQEAEEHLAPRFIP